MDKEDKEIQNICWYCKRERNFPDCGAKYSDYITKQSVGVIDCKLFIKQDSISV